MGTPAACSLCDQPCPSNIVSTITSLVDAIFADVLTIARVIGVCFGEHGGIGACVCSLVETLQPQWRRVSRNPVTRCENGDPFGLLLDGITERPPAWPSRRSTTWSTRATAFSTTFWALSATTMRSRACAFRPMPTRGGAMAARSRRAKPPSCSSASTRWVAWKRCARGSECKPFAPATACSTSGMSSFSPATNFRTGARVCGRLWSQL